MVRTGCAAMTCAPVFRSCTLAASQGPDHRGTSRTCHSSFATHHCDFLIDITAVRNDRNSSKNTTITFSNRLRIASLRSYFAPLASLLSSHFSPVAGFLIATQVLEIGLTHSQQMRRLFLIATISALCSGLCLVKQSVFRGRPPRERRASVTVSGCHESQVTNQKSRNPERRRNPKRVP
jgi:hypothetical protein